MFSFLDIFAGSSVFGSFKAFADIISWEGK